MTAVFDRAERYPRFRHPAHDATLIGTYSLSFQVDGRKVVTVCSAAAAGTFHELFANIVLSAEQVCDGRHIIPAGR